jgi:hypothetical protein
MKINRMYILITLLVIVFGFIISQITTPGTLERNFSDDSFDGNVKLTTRDLAITFVEIAIKGEGHGTPNYPLKVSLYIDGEEPRYLICDNNKFDNTGYIKINCHLTYITWMPGTLERVDSIGFIYPMPGWPDDALVFGYGLQE